MQKETDEKELKELQDKLEEIWELEQKIRTFKSEEGKIVVKSKEDCDKLLDTVNDQKEKLKEAEELLGQEKDSE